MLLRYPTGRAPSAHIVAAMLVVILTSGCRRTDARYFPLEPQRWWVYAIQETILDDHRSSRFLALNVGAVGNSDQPASVQMTQTHSADYLRRHGSGVERVASLRPGMAGPRPDDPPRVVLPPTLELGTSWVVRSTLSLIESRTFEPRDRIIPRRLGVELTKQISATDTLVRVGERRFEHCLQIDGSGHATVPTDRGNTSAEVTVILSEWYAPGVGLVKLDRSESSDSAFLKGGQQRWNLLDYGR